MTIVALCAPRYLKDVMDVPSELSLESSPILFDMPELRPGEIEPTRLEGSPPELKLRWHTPMPVISTRADLDIPLSDDAEVRGGDCRHRLVTIGDSVTQGFKSYAITDTDLSWPAMVADELGLAGDEFTYPDFPGPNGIPGLPLNLERLFRILQERVNPRSLRQNGFRTAEIIAETARAVASYWDAASESTPEPASAFHHNLAVSGYDVRDSF